jgi:hypothetical protein
MLYAHRILTTIQGLRRLCAHGQLIKGFMLSYMAYELQTFSFHHELISLIS